MLAADGLLDTTPVPLICPWNIEGIRPTSEATPPLFEASTPERVVRHA